jgi:uncharacterized membrane protein (DUF106 family)
MIDQIISFVKIPQVIILLLLFIVGISITLFQRWQTGAIVKAYNNRIEEIKKQTWQEKEKEIEQKLEQMPVPTTTQSVLQSLFKKRDKDIPKELNN